MPCLIADTWYFHAFASLVWSNWNMSSSARDPFPPLLTSQQPLREVPGILELMDLAWFLEASVASMWLKNPRKRYRILIGNLDKMSKLNPRNEVIRSCRPESVFQPAQYILSASENAAAVGSREEGTNAATMTALSSSPGGCPIYHRRPCAPYAGRARGSSLKGIDFQGPARGVSPR